MAPITSSENPYRRQLDGIRSARHPAKRLKSEHDSSCSDRSTVSDDSALIRTSVPPESTDNTEADSDDSSELSESSEEPSDESSSEDDEADEEDIPAEEEEVVNLRANRGEKPVMKLKADEEEGDIRSFLKDFLPKLKAANEELEAQKKSGTLKKSEIEQDEVEDTEKQYIEMDLGLGVLEAKETGDSSDSESEEVEQQGEILRKLMGQSTRKSEPGIQEVENEQSGT